MSTQLMKTKQKKNIEFKNRNDFTLFHFEKKSDEAKKIAKKLKNNQLTTYIEILLLQKCVIDHWNMDIICKIY